MKYLLSGLLFLGLANASDLELKTQQLKDLGEAISKAQEYCQSVTSDPELLNSCAFELKDKFKSEMRKRFASFSEEIIAETNKKHKEAECKADALKEVEAINAAKPGTIVISGAEKCDEIKILIEANKPAPPVEHGPPVHP